MASLAPRGPKSSRATKQPKHRMVLENLRSQIVSGHYPSGSRLPTETELPKLLKAGKQTVVRALNELVREGLVVRRRGDGSYVAEKSRPPLLPGRHLRIGVLWPHSVLPDRLLQYFQGGISRGVLEAWGLEPMLGNWTEGSNNEQTCATWTSVARGVTVECVGESLRSRERHPDLQAIIAGRYDGLMLLSILEEDWIETVLELSIPTVLVDFTSERFASRADQLYMDPLPAYRAVVKRFAMMGLKRIHFVGALMTAPVPSKVTDPQEIQAALNLNYRADPDSYLRLAAWRAGMDACGLEVPDGASHFIPPHKAAELAAQLLALPENQRPEGVLCHAIETADILMRTFAAQGVRLYAAGCEGGTYNGPALPIRADGMELGRLAAEVLLWKIRQPNRSVLRVGVPMRFQGAQAEVSMLV